MVEGQRLDRIRELAWRELERVEEEEVLLEMPGITPVSLEPDVMRKERRTLTAREMEVEWPLG